MTSPTDEEPTTAEIVAEVMRRFPDMDPDPPQLRHCQNWVLARLLADRLEGRGGGEVVAWQCVGCDRVAASPIDDLAALRAGGKISCCPERKLRPLYAREGEGWREAEGWKLVPTKALPAMLERAAFNLCAEYGVEFVKPLGKFAQDAYAELLSAAPKP